MTTKTIIKVSQNQDLEIPPEIKSQLQPLSEYEMTFTEDQIVLKKIAIAKEKRRLLTMRPASGKPILRHLGTWEGEDFEECLQAVYDNRSQIKV